MSEQQARYRTDARAAPAGGRAARDQAARDQAARDWDGEGVRALRRHLGETQRQFADRLGTNQQTVSEWERRARRPRRMARRLLGLVAEQAGYYDTGGGSAEGGETP